MKKLLVSLAFLVSSVVTVSAQKAFNHLSLGIEIGTTGAGIELAVPVISNHVILKAGYNLPQLGVVMSQKFDLRSVNDQIAEINSSLAAEGAPERINTRFSDITVSVAPKVSFNAAKLLFEIYPFKKSSFHLVAGAYLGLSDDFISLDVDTDPTFWKDYNNLKKDVAVLDGEYDCGTMEDPKFNIGKSTYQIKEKNGAGHVGAYVQLAKVRPYFGLGFGRSIPKTRFGFQFNLGAWMHGNPVLKSDNMVTYDPSLEELVDQAEIDALSRISVYPNLSIKIIYRIF